VGITSTHLLLGSAWPGAILSIDNVEQLNKYKITESHVLP